MPTLNIGPLVEQQARRWALANEKKRQRPKPSIAFSRLPYSGASEIAEKLGRRLDFGVFDREIVDQIASEEGVSRVLVEGLDEHAENAIERHVLDTFRHRRFTESDYLRDTVRIVTTLGLRGRAILVGRGASCILPAETTLRVLVVAPVEWRQARLAKVRGLSAEEAAERLAREDEERRAFWKESFDVDPTDPWLYDVCVNSATLTIDGAASVVERAFSERFSD